MEHYQHKENRLIYNIYIYMWLYIYDYIYIWLYMDISNDVHVVFSMVFPFESPFSGRSSPWAGALEETSWWMPWLSKAADGRMRWVKMPRDLWKWLNYHICTFFNWSYLIMLYHFRWCSPYLWSCFGYARLISFPMLSCFFSDSSTSPAIKHSNGKLRYLRGKPSAYM